MSNNVYNQFLGYSLLGISYGFSSDSVSFANLVPTNATYHTNTLAVIKGNMNRTFRKGAIGALTDEYEKALNELKDLLLQIPDAEFQKVYNEKTKVDFQSVRNIVLHMINSGYGYANYVRKRFGNQYVVPKIEIEKTEQGISELEKMFEYTVETFEDKWHLTYNKLMTTIIKTSWSTYDLEAIVEHAIVHILRHRLQIEKMISKYRII